MVAAEPVQLSKLIILGAGKPFRGEQHSVLRGTTGRRRVLDWLLHSMRSVRPTVHFVGGYQLDAIAERYPDLHYTVNPHWETTGAAASLLEAPLDDSCVHYVSYADVMFRDSAVQALSAADADLAVLVDSEWRERFEGRSGEDLERCEKANVHHGDVTRLGRDILADIADAEFVGLVKLQPAVAKFLATEASRFPQTVKVGSLTQLLEYLRVRGFSIAAVDVSGDWAELNEPDDLSRFVLGTKAQTLHRLQGVVAQSRIEDQVSFTVAEWQERASDIREAIANRLTQGRLVVRSSALSEDGFGVSNAGAYTSVLNVDGQSEAAITQAVEQVIESYPDGHPENQVLVQPMLEQVIASGVAFTKTLSAGAPYYVVNYDDTTSSTESITSGASRDHKTLYVHRDAPTDLPCLPENLAGLMPALREIEDLLNFDSLDIEFAITSGGLVHILQVRPIAVQHELNSTESASALLADSVARFRRLQTPAPNVVGEHGVFGVMPDWNPAEIIGTRPGRLAASLYRYLIMDDIWATQRAEYGYRDVRPQPLLRLFAGHPYVDVRASFNSFVPASISDELAGRLVNFYLDWLKRHPHLHDKVEFDVVPTCYALDFDRWQRRLSEDGQFSRDDIRTLASGLKSITRTAIERTADDLASVDSMTDRFNRIAESPLADLEKACVLLEDCRRYGTLVFSHLARSAFVAVTLLRSAVQQSVISQKAMDQFLNSIRTVSHRFTDDARRVSQGEISMADFVKTYGHLRPGTYDITSPSYGDHPEHFLEPVVQRSADAGRNQGADVPDLAQWEVEKQAFIDALVAEGLADDGQAIEGFLHAAIEGREYGKFVFTRYLSQALDALSRFAKERELSRDQMAQIPLESLFALRSGAASVQDEPAWLAAIAEEGSEMARAVALVELPPLLSCEDDFQAFLVSDSQANFIGNQRVSADSVDLARQESAKTDSLAGKIALIPQADPGYDWLFGHGIAGLITTFGGANSHMAIRAAEFGLPAAIGVGEGRYESLARASVLALDPVNKRIEVVQ